MLTNLNSNFKQWFYSTEHMKLKYVLQNLELVVYLKSTLKMISNAPTFMRYLWQYEVLFY